MQFDPIRFRSMRQATVWSTSHTLAQVGLKLRLTTPGQARRYLPEDSIEPLATVDDTEKTHPIRATIRPLCATLALLLAVPSVANRLPVECLERVDASRVCVQGGTCTMGCTPEQRSCEPDEYPALQVVVARFEMATHEVSQALWEP